MLKEMQIMSKDLAFVRQVVTALKTNTTIHRLEVELPNEVAERQGISERYESRGSFLHNSKRVRSSIGRSIEVRDGDTL